MILNCSRKTALGNFFNQAVSRWIDYFSIHFRPLNGPEQKFVTRKVKQHYAALAFFRLNDPMVEQLSRSIALHKVRTQFPYYFRRFEAFWQDFTQAVPEYNRRQLRLYSFLTCVTLFSLENCLPEISVYAFSESSELFSIFIKEKINLNFKNRYHLTFVENPRDAQLIIGTSPTCKNFYMIVKRSLLFARISRIPTTTISKQFLKNL